MTLRLYNTLTKTKEEFVPLDAANVRMYVCGPTVYDFAHIGNARPAIVFDVLFRLLRHLYGDTHVTYVRNITDVDDKINARALELATEKNIPVEAAREEITAITAKQYHDDVTALGCLRPSREPRATEYIRQMIQMIEILIKRGHAYEEGGHVLYRVKSKPDYGKLSRRSLDEMIAGARVDVAPYKEDPMDFVLWKPSTPEQPGWEHNKWGRGRPGWHIECSAMSDALLGETFDIHGGGIDLLFPHHENEIAQSEGAHHGAPPARYWMHNGFLQVEGEKMSKSLGNFVTIRELLNDWPGGALRLAMLQTHYRQPINWTSERIRESNSELQEWASVIYGSHADHMMQQRRVNKTAATPHETVLAALADDLNTPSAVAALRALFKKRDDEKAYEALISSCEFFGLFGPTNIGAYASGVSGTNMGVQKIFEFHDLVRAMRVALINGDENELERIRSEIKAKGAEVDLHHDGHISLKPANGESRDPIRDLIDARNAARKAKNWKESDRIRDELLAKGIQLKDNPDGTTTWEVKR